MSSSRLPPALAGGFIAELDGLRGIAIVTVMLHRFWPDTGPLARYAQLGWIGVDLFFVISGFLITGILLDTKSEPRSFRNFYARRVLRIFPLYYLFIGAVFLVVPTLQPGPYLSSPFIQSSGSPLWYFLYLGNVPEAATGHDTPLLVGMVWSLAIEEQFYLVFPLFVGILSRKRLCQVLIGAILFAPAFRLATMLAFPHNERMQYLATPARVDVIAVGCLLAILVRAPSFRPTRRRVGTALAAALMLFVATFLVGGLDRTRPFGRVLGYTVVAGLFGLLLLWTVMNRGNASTSVLRRRPLMYFGKLCYGLYLLHRPAMILVSAAAAKLRIVTPHAHVLIVLADLGVALGLASTSWYAFERPILRLKSRFANRTHPAQCALDPHAQSWSGPERWAQIQWSADAAAQSAGAQAGARNGP